MRIVFPYNSIAGYEHLGIEYLSSVLKSAGHNVMLAMDTDGILNDFLRTKPVLKMLGRDGDRKEKLIAKIKDFKPDLLCFSVVSENYAPTIHLAKVLREKLGQEVKNIFGGIHATSVPELVIRNPYVDFVMMGESELSLLMFIEAMEGKRSLESVPNLVYKKDENVLKNGLAPYIRDMDSLPFPDKKLFYEKIPSLANDYYIMTGRGCPYRCTYCCNSFYHSLYNFEKNHIRKRSIENVIQELVIAKDKYQPKLISFVDELFVLNKKDYLYPFLEEYEKKVNLPYYCQMHPDHVDSELAYRLSRSNCWNVTLGVQSGSPRIRNGFYKRKTSNDKVVDVCKILKSEKLFLTVDIILGCPTEEKKDLDLTIELMEQIIPDRIASFFMAYYPGTELTEAAIKNNYLSSDIVQAYKEGTEATHYALKLPGEFALPLDRHKYWACQSKMQLLCVIKNVKLARFGYRIIDKMPLGILTIFSKLITIFASLKNLDKRGYQRLRLVLGRKQVP